jgi:hypothetical protein
MNVGWCLATQVTKTFIGVVDILKDDNCAEVLRLERMNQRGTVLLTRPVMACDMGQKRAKRYITGGNLLGNRLFERNVGSTRFTIERVTIEGEYFAVDI